MPLAHGLVVRIVVADRDQLQHGRIAQAVREKTQELERRRVAPVQILDDEHQAAVDGGLPAEIVGDQLKPSQALDVGAVRPVAGRAP